MYLFWYKEVELKLNLCNIGSVFKKIVVAMLNKAKAAKQHPKKKKMAFARTDKEYIFY